MMDNNPTISIIIPVFNVEKYISVAVDSVLSQNVVSMEVIAVNDGSDDDSGNRLEEYSKNDSRLRVIHQPNKGLSAVRNLGLKLARGKYVYFFDSDDVLLPDSLNKVINRLETADSDMARFSVGLIDEDGNQRTSKNKTVSDRLDISEPLRGEEFLQYLFYSGKYGAIVQKFIFLKSFLVHHDLHFDEGYIHEDEAFTMETLCLAEKVVSFNEVMVLKRTRSGSIMSSRRDEKNVAGWLKASSRLLQFINEKNVSAETKTVIKTKVSQLILISLNNIREINERTGSALNLFDYISYDELKEIGFIFSLKVRYNILYRAYHKITSLLPFKF